MNKEKLESRIQSDKDRLNELKRVEYCRILKELKNDYGLTQKDIADRFKVSGAEYL